jgi:hypothetical protein
MVVTGWLGTGARHQFGWWRVMAGDVAEQWPAVIALIADHGREREREGADKRGPPARERVVAREKRRARLTGGAGLTTGGEARRERGRARGRWAACAGRGNEARGREGERVVPDSAQPSGGDFLFLFLFFSYFYFLDPFFFQTIILLIS